MPSKFRPGFSSVLALAASAFALSGCIGSVGEAFDSRQNVGPCPPAASLYDSARIVELEGGESFGNITYTGEITGVEMFCRYAGSDPIRAEMEIDFAFGKGPAATDTAHTYTYWVAVTRRNGDVLAKEYFNVAGDFRESIVDAARIKLDDIVIPRADETISGVNFEVLVGFHLTDEQLEFNRAGKRFRLDANSGS
ncbi:MAG: hypothetical protein MRY64_10535 [Hyphomonadaceae bacterium]|nr:hypothetical protein [Hyphomonadaceae bacterium]